MPISVSKTKPILLNLQIALSGWLTGHYNFRCQPVDYSNSPRTLRVRGVCVAFRKNTPKKKTNKWNLLKTKHNCLFTLILVNYFPFIYSLLCVRVCLVTSQSNVSVSVCLSVHVCVCLCACLCLCLSIYVHNCLNSNIILNKSFINYIISYIGDSNLEYTAPSKIAWNLVVIFIMIHHCFFDLPLPITLFAIFFLLLLMKNVKWQIGLSTWIK